MPAVKKFIDWLLNKPKVIHTTPLRPELIERDEAVRELSKTLQARTSELAKERAKRRKEYDKKKEKDKDILLSEALQEQQKEITRKKYSGGFSFGKFYRAFFRMKKYRNLELVDREDNQVIGLFGDFIEIPGGYMGITDKKGNVIIYGKTINQIVYKPDSIANHIRRGRIPLPLDKEGNYFPDIEEQEVPDAYYDHDTQMIRYTRSVKPMKDIITAKELRIRELEEKIDIDQDVIVKFKNTIDDLRRSLSMANNTADISQTELSKAMERVMQIEAKSNEMQRKMVVMMNTNARHELFIEKLESVNRELLDKVSETGSETQFTRVKFLVKDLIEWARLNAPHTIIQQAEKPFERSVNPGQKI